ncbi:hypothetical protein JCM3775_005495 [Rhodotorula graminis]|uniref:SP-RING-type domain-containing protein n=1 Tax=Rhodotorula graminis (strain WP1) TaxID=578459 RepID=A0A194SAD2_RHOGW|nr:uncharacterized protein RHOBADRAFT_51403 [Rhodotorula graminis WP1]KPV77567.1 hypothetical protein RHOBADRAFT_51403 [Rhodotorula graminis WP1]
MPSLDKRHRKKQRVADSDGDASDASAPDHREPDTQARRNDAILAKVDPEYRNTPVDLRQGESKLRLVASQLTTVKKRVAETVGALSDVAGEWAQALAEAHRDDEYDEDSRIAALLADDTISQLDKDVRSAIDRDAELEIRVATLSDLRGRLSQGHQLRDVNKEYEQRVQPKLDEYRSKTPRQRFENLKTYNAFRNLVWETFTDGAGVPNVKKFLPREDGDEDSDDEDVEFGAQTHSFTCPITLATLEDPYTSTVCPHSFSGPAIKEMLSGDASGRVGCPVTGCDKVLSAGTIARDEGLRRRVAAYEQRVREGRTQQGGATQGRTFVQMDLDSEEEEGDEDEAEEERVAAVKKVKREKGRAA